MAGKIDRSRWDTVFLGWLLIAGLLTFAGFLIYQYGLFSAVWEADSTRLSLIILLLFMLTSLYLGRCAWRMGSEYRELFTSEPGVGSLIHEHRSLMGVGAADGLLLDRLTERVHGGHHIGWFMSDVLIRLGLVGTVIGFILMLSSVSELDEQNTQVLKQLLTQMSGGMQVALYTTLSGLLGGLMLSVQCQWLDRAGDRLISRVIEIVATERQVTE